MAYTLAKETSWSEAFIWWELPLIRLLKYFHASLWMQGAWTIKPTATAQEQLSELSSLVDNWKEDEDEADA